MSVSRKHMGRRLVFGERLAQARSHLKLSQEALAEAVGTTSRSISRWEQNQTVPQQYYLERLCQVLQTTPEELFGNSTKTFREEDSSVSFWYVPYARNPYFTGRETLLHQLHEQLHIAHQVTLTQPHIMSGLGGIGKTQAVLEYAYRFRHDYQSIFWISAETRETLMSDYLALAQLFQLPEKESPNQSFIREAVKRWFQSHTNWLLVFDNAEDLELLHTMLPDTSQGHILVTTRSQIIGTLGLRLDLQKMDQVEGTLFLLRRAKLLNRDALLETAPVSMRAQAETLVNLLDGLPLALDQAGAYIEETSCTLAEYLDRYTTQQNALLKYRGVISNHHPASVTMTFSLAFQKVEQASPLAADLLRVCVFLHAEAIPEEFISQAGETLGPTLQALTTDPLLLAEAIRELRRFSLLHREPETRTLSIHRLLQRIILDGMNEIEHQVWIKRILLTMLQIFPTYSDGMLSTKNRQAEYQRYITHVLACANFIQKGDITSPEAEEFLYQAAIYAHLWGDVTLSMSLLHQALRHNRKQLIENDGKSALYLNALAILSVNLRQYTQAEDYFRQALAIRERVNGPDHQGVADTLRELANLFCRRGMYAQAETFAQKALAIEEQIFGPVHYEVALILALLGVISLRKGKLAQADHLFWKALRIYEKTLGESHFFAAPCLRNLGYLSFLRGQYAQAIDFYQQASSIYEKNLGPYHAEIASNMNKLGYVYFAQKQYEKAEFYYQKALSIFEKIPETARFEAAYSLIDLGELFMVQGHSNKAKCYLERAFLLLGEMHVIDQVDQQELIRCLIFIGDRLVAQGDRMEAQIYYQRAQVLAEQVWGSDHALTKHCRSLLDELSE